MNIAGHEFPSSSLLNTDPHTPDYILGDTTNDSYDQSGSLTDFYRSSPKDEKHMSYTDIYGNDANNLESTLLDTN